MAEMAIRSRKLASVVTSMNAGGASARTRSTVGSNFAPKLSEKRPRSGQPRGIDDILVGKTPKTGPSGLANFTAVKAASNLAPSPETRSRYVAHSASTNVIP
jgi:hypothetical protein